MLLEISHSIKQIIYPHVSNCSFCDKTLTLYENTICDKCIEKINSSKENYKECVSCGKLLAEHTLCSACINKKYPFVKARAVGVYSGIVKEILHTYKYTGKRSLANPMARLMALEAIKNRDYLTCDCISFVPLSKLKLKERGFNQAELLALELGKYLRIPTKSLLEKIVETEPMAKLSREDRLKNLKGAFKSIGKIHGKNIILVDDVITTGSTITLCCKELQAAGANKIYVLTFATGFAKA